MSEESTTTEAAGRRTGMAPGSNLDQMMPVLLFLVFYNLVDIKAAVVASTLWSIKAAVGRRRRGLAIGLWLPGVTAYLVVRSAITILVDEDIVDFGISSEAVYFGIGFFTKILVGIALGASAIVGRSFLAWGLPKVVTLPDGLASEPRFVSTMAIATWFIAAFEILTAVWDIWLFNNSGINLFLVTRFGVNFVLGFVAITGGLLFIDRRLDPIESYPGIVELMETSGRLSKS